MAFNPEIHHRRSIRLRDYDYSVAGAYFITICAFQRECLFGEMVDGEMRINERGRIVESQWRQLPGHYFNIRLDEFVVMPNHAHGIIEINEQPAGARFIAPDNLAECDNLGAMNRAPTVGEIVRAFKARCTHEINHICDNPGVPVWQRNYYERVIRDERELAAIRQYIVANPTKWIEDENHPGQA